MGMIGMGNECYLYVNGISVSKPIWLHDTVCISPAKSAIKWKEVMPLFENEIDFSRVLKKLLTALPKKLLDIHMQTVEVILLLPSPGEMACD